MLKKYKLLQITQFLFYLNAVIWLALSISSIGRILSNHAEPTTIAWIIAILMFGNVAAMILSGILIVRPHPFYFYFALTVLGINILLTVIDQFGFVDLLTMLIDLALFGLLIAYRKNRAP